MSLSPIGQISTSISGQNPYLTSSKELATASEIKPKSFLEQLTNKEVSITREENSPKPSLESMQTKLAELKLKGRNMLNHPLPAVVDDYVTNVKDFLNDLRDSAHDSHKKD